MKTTAPIALAATPTIVLAHPGPPGHTHEGGSDDWPFDPIISASLALLILAAATVAVRKLRQPSA